MRHQLFRRSLAPLTSVSARLIGFCGVVALAISATLLAHPAASQEVAMGNGEENAIVVDDLTRERNVFTFAEVTLAEPGWLVLHPFEDGAPLGKIYVGARYLPAGTHRDVRLEVSTAPEPKPGTNFVVMLHGDVDDDQTFDFYFVDERNVADKAVFEGNTMIGHVITSP